MMLRRTLLLGALASCLLLAAGGGAEAAYTYTSTITITGGSVAGTIAKSAGISTFTTTGGTIVGLQDITAPGTFLTSGPLSANIGNVGLTTTNMTAAGESFTVNYTDVVTITNPTPGGATGPFTINGTLTLSGVRTDGTASAGSVTNRYAGTFSQTLAIPAGQLFNVSFGDGSVNDFFGPPTVNNPGGTANGSLGAVINPLGVPEPASVAMMGTGLVAVIGLALRRTRKA